MAGFFEGFFKKKRVVDKAGKDASGSAPGETVRMGCFAGEAIRWRILKREEDRLLLLSVCALDTRSYHDAFEDVFWADCAIRDWLNGEFYETVFSGEEKARIIRCRVTTADSTLYKTRGGPDSEDRLFLLSLEEAREFKAVNEENMCLPTAHARERGAYTNETCDNCWWWLRTPARWQNKALTIDSQGEVNMYGRRVDTDVVTVRPAMWVHV